MRILVLCHPAVSSQCHTNIIAVSSQFHPSVIPVAPGWSFLQTFWSSFFSKNCTRLEAILIPKYFSNIVPRQFKNIHLKLLYCSVLKGRLNSLCCFSGRMSFLSSLRMHILFIRIAQLYSFYLLAFPLQRVYSNKIYEKAFKHTILVIKSPCIWKIIWHWDCFSNTTLANLDLWFCRSMILFYTNTLPIVVCLNVYVLAVTAFAICGSFSANALKAMRPHFQHNALLIYVRLH